MPPALKLLQQLLTKGVKATATLWPPLQSAYEQVHQAAHILANPQHHTGTQVRERYLAHVCQLQEQKASLEPLGEAIEHFCHITDNFAPGLFHCYDVQGLPRTNNDLEHCGWRWHGFMSDEPQVDGEPFLAWSCAVPFA